MDLIVLHKVQEILIFNGHHLMERQRPIPFVCAKVKHQRDNRRDFVVFVESRKILTTAMPF